MQLFHDSRFLRLIVRTNRRCKSRSTVVMVSEPIRSINDSGRAPYIVRVSRTLTTSSMFSPAVDGDTKLVVLWGTESKTVSNNNTDPRIQWEDLHLEKVDSVTFVWETDHDHATPSSFNFIYRTDSCAIVREIKTQIHNYIK